MNNVRKRIIAASLFLLEALGCFVLAAVHLGAGLDLPGFVQPRASVAMVSAVCGSVLVGAAYAGAARRPEAWEIGIGAQIMVVAAMLAIDKVLAVTDVTPIYRIGLGIAGLGGILLMTSAGKEALRRKD